jgi:hypothetical protein
VNGENAAAAREVVMLAACAADELLPGSPDLPADVFTACLTSPIKMALRWFCLRSPLRHEAGLDPELADAMPGLRNNRKTPLGELNWIFTAITDTIAWNVLPRPLFQRLFRQDLLVASLFRNYLLAERVLRALWLHAALLAGAAAHGGAPHVGGVGHGAGGVPAAAAGAAGGGGGWHARRVCSVALFQRPAQRLRGLARARR